MSREKFEVHCVEQLIVARAAAQARGEKLHDDVGETSVESLCWRHRDGSYGGHMLNAAWMGYQWAMADIQAEQGKPQATEACEWG